MHSQPRRLLKVYFVTKWNTSFFMNYLIIYIEKEMLHMLREIAFLQMLHVDALPRIHLQNAKAIDMSEEEILHNITRNESVMAQIFKLQKCIRKVHFFLSTTPYFFLNVVHCPLNLIRNS